MDTYEPQLLPEPYPFWHYRDLLVFLALAIPAFLFTALAVSFLIKAAGGEELPAGVRLLIPQFAGYGTLLATLWLFFRSKFDRGLLESFQWRFSPGETVRALAQGAALAIGIGVLGIVLRTPPTQGPFLELLNDPVSIALVGVFSVTLAPVFEELFFRGLIQPLLVRSLGIALGIALPSVVFGLAHGGQYAWSWQHVVLIAAAGVAFGWKRQASQSLAAASAMHAAYNLIIFTAYLAGKASGIENG